jgi:hypothetical protein
VSDDFYHDDPVQEETKRKLRNNLLTPLALIIAAVFFFQSTLAGNITLSSGTGIEFGQGVSQAVACSGSTNLIVTPRASFTNGAGSAGAHYLQSVTVSNIPTSCYGVDFIISAYGDSSSTPLALFNGTSTSAVIYDDNGTFLPNNRSTGMAVESSTGTFTATFTAPVALASTVFKLTIQSSAHTRLCAQGGACSVGDVGPGGGRIFYVALSPFACGPTRSATCTYLEAAPSGWNGGADPFRRWANTTYRYTAVNNATSPETATATAIGWGYRNTRAIILQGNTDTATSAAALADSYTVTVSGVTYDDWYLPSKDELNQMCKWVRGVAWTSDETVCSGGAINSGTGAAGFEATTYYSSSENSASYAWFHNFGDGAQGAFMKADSRYVRPVRAF